ncbi:2-hydroxyacid dehydrogenase [Rubrobacter aplysinae]|uniref:2-hydroxyacid dehydrogenase n=1 Tax=Rubrobacter aplysinae TaxID=909625 RepID=UPI00064B99E8|nr:D-glycerate dehydrogenase [Rubrobacter aplysinae]
MSEKVIVAREIPDAGLRILREAGHEVITLSDASQPPPSHGDLFSALPGAAALLTTVTEKIDAGVLGAAGRRLRIVSNMAVGYDNIDVEAATQRGITVTNTPGVLDETTADTAFMLLLAAARRLGEGERLLRAGEWHAWGPKQLVGPDVWGKTLGIVGLGRIGEAVARRARGFGMKILYHARSEKPGAEAELQAERSELEDLLRDSDFVSIHTPLNEGTRHLIGARELSLMGESAVLVNTSRGPVVDEAALADALAEGTIFAAGLDVYEEEPKVHPKLMELDNVVLAPHIGSASIETRDKMASVAAENVVAALRGETPPNAVNS